MRVTVYSRWLGVTGLVVAVGIVGPASAGAQEANDAPKPPAPRTPQAPQTPQTPQDGQGAQQPSSPPPASPQKPQEGRGTQPASPPPASTPPATGSTNDEALTHYRLGHAYYESGRFDLAIGELKQAYELSKAPHMLYDLFLAYRDAGQLGQAIETLERYLKLEPHAADHDALQQRLDTMKRLQEQKATGEEEADAQDENAAAGTGSGQTQSGGQEHGSSDAGGSKSGASAGPQPTSASTVPGPRSHAAAPWVVMGIGGALLVGGAVTGVLALRLEKDLEKRCPNHACPPGVSFEADASRGQKLATATDVLLGTGLFAVAAAVAMKLMLGSNTTERAPTRPQTPIAAVGCSADGCMGEVRVHF